MEDNISGQDKMTPQMIDDDSLLKASMDGNTDAFGALVQKYQSYIRTLTYSATGDMEKSEDIAQNVFVISWRNLSQLRDSSKFKSWLYQITHNEIVKYYRKRKKDIISHAAPFDSARTTGTSTPGPAEIVMNRERREFIRQALDRIPSKYREPLILYYWEGRSVRQVAQRFELNEGVAKKRISRARGMLRADVEAMVEETIRKAPSGQKFSACVIGLIGAGALLTASTAATAAQTTGLGVSGSNALSSLLSGVTVKIATIAAGIILLTAGTAYVLRQQNNSSGGVITQLPEELNSGLVLYFSFDNIRRQIEQTTIIDDSPAGNNGIFIAGRFSAGRFGQAFECSADNKQDSIIVKDSDSLDLDAVTITAWIRTSRRDDQWGRILDKGWQTAYNLCIGGEIKGQRWPDKMVLECAGNSLISKSSVVDGQWHFVAGSYDGEIQKFYADGILNAKTVLKKAMPMKHNNTDIHIGSLAVPETPPYNEAYYDGLIDELRVYNRILSDEEIQILYQYQPMN